MMEEIFKESTPEENAREKDIAALHAALQCRSGWFRTRGKLRINRRWVYFQVVRYFYPPSLVSKLTHLKAAGHPFPKPVSKAKLLKEARYLAGVYYGDRKFEFEIVNREDLPNLGYGRSILKGTKQETMFQPYTPLVEGPFSECTNRHCPIGCPVSHCYPTMSERGRRYGHVDLETTIQ